MSGALRRFGARLLARLRRTPRAPQSTPPAPDFERALRHALVRSAVSIRVASLEKLLADPAAPQGATRRTDPARSI